MKEKKGELIKAILDFFQGKSSVQSLLVLIDDANELGIEEEVKQLREIGYSDWEQTREILTTMLQKLTSDPVSSHS